jgi:DNA modification methylase
MMKEYTDFLENKSFAVVPSGFDVPDADVNPMLFPWQRRIVTWACRRGRSAVFADCGLGKTPIQLEWARQACKYTGKPTLIFAPLAVSAQTVREGDKFDVHVTKCRHQDHVKPGVNITNYEMLEHFEPSAFGAIVLDESSILKSFDGRFRTMITKFGRSIPLRLACTATPAPNDIIEICNHADFLDIMSSKEILALFFRQDGNTVHNWRFKDHAKADFWQWMASWCIAMRKPSDIGGDDGKFILPPLDVRQVVVNSEAAPGGFLFAVEARTLSERRNARRASIGERIAEAARIVAEKPEDHWLVWCDLNAESDALKRAIPGAVEVKGSDSNEHKETSMLGFSAGDVRVLVTKPSIAGFGMNWQHCSNVIFFGLSDSFERYYQAIRRCWRFGQTSTVNVHIVTSDAEGAVVRNIERKEADANQMFDSIIANMGEMQMESVQRGEMDYEMDEATGDGWRMMLGDCVERIKEVESDSVGLSVFSPPFPGMYAYTNSVRDMGNVRDQDEMIEQYSFLATELLRVVKPGRSCCVHLTQGVAFKGVDGYIGIKDFRGAVIKVMENAGWIYYGEVCIDKDPQVKAIRTKDAGLLFKSLANDSSRMHMALADYMLQFRKPGDNKEPIRAGKSDRYGNSHGWITADEWIRWARPVWYGYDQDMNDGIKETDVLRNYRHAKDEEDEKHICPLQLGVIERAIKLWTNPGDVVLSPFGGIGSEGYKAIQLGRRFVGIELKPSYWRIAIDNLARAKGSVQGALI